MLGKVLGAARKLLGSDTAPAQPVQTAEQMRKVLERERARTDRSGDPFSIITFVPCATEVENATWQCLGRILQERLRSTDEVGWLDDGQLCAVLPGTAGSGAWKVADEVCLRFPEDVPPPICSIFSYPSETGAPDGQEQPGTPDSRQQPIEPAPAQPVGSLHPLFLQPMPWWKRTLDILGAGFGLILLTPLFAVVALAIKLTSRGPVFFRQLRSGRGGRPFMMWKFRSMVVNAESQRDKLVHLNEQDGPAFKVRRDPRITRLGRLIRATSIDELPQLWNVLMGDMSLVGPRPLPCRETAGCVLWQRRRLDVIPGLTCIWQVSGRSSVSFADWVRMDVQYIRSRSPWQDLKLILLTVPAVVLRKGAH
jgi:lipopolysaccharide/colanic/teichoic acid biosynthesis glycosyltransferase